MISEDSIWKFNAYLHCENLLGGRKKEMRWVCGGRIGEREWGKLWIFEMRVNRDFVGGLER
jgi:hypothetical protein